MDEIRLEITDTEKDVVLAASTSDDGVLISLTDCISHTELQLDMEHLGTLVRALEHVYYESVGELISNTRNVPGGNL